MTRQKEYNLCVKKTPCSECNDQDFCSAWVSFVLQHNYDKKYSHFDRRVSLALPSIRKYVLDNKKVASHGFYPFIYFQKKNQRFGKSRKKKIRDLYYCAHLDRCVYQRYAFLINQKYNQRVKELHINDVAIAYRDNLEKNNIDFAKNAFDSIKEKEHCLVIVGDFTSFFDKLDHTYLKTMLCNLLDVDKLPQDYFAVYKNITRFASWDWESIVEQTGHKITERGIRTKLNKQDILMTKKQFHNGKHNIKPSNNTGKGVPQGSPISAVLSNVYMIQFDKDINNYVLGNNGVYMRYSDDFLIVLPYESENKIEEHRNWIFSYFNAKIELVELQKEKTEVYVYNQGSLVTYPSNEPSSLDYLGFIFNGIDIKLRPKAITKYYYRMRRKARCIGRNNWISPTGKRISARNLYRIYSSGGEQQTFIDYAKRAKELLQLKDIETDALIKHHKRKIAHAIKSGQK